MSELVTYATPVQRVLGIMHWVTIKGVKMVAASFCTHGYTLRSIISFRIDDLGVP
jgi:hypothetical protein